MALLSVIIRPEITNQITMIYRPRYTSGRFDRRAFNGGRRAGAGRPLSPERQAAVDFALEEVVVKERRYGQVRLVKKTRMRVITDTLYSLAKQGNLSAIKELNNRMIGRAT